MPSSYPHKSPSTAIFESIGDTGLQRYGGFINEEWLAQLQGSEKFRVMREMIDNDANVGTVLRLTEAVVRQTDFYAESADEDNDEANKQRDFLDECMDDMSHTWDYFMGESMTCKPHGWAAHEILYKRRMGPEQGSPTKRSRYNDGKIGWRKFEFRSQDSLDHWDYSDDGSLRGMYQYGVDDPIPIEKMILSQVRGTKYNPEGYSDLRPLYRTYFYLKHLQETEAIVYERGPGFPIFFVPPKLLGSTSNLNSDEIATLATMKKVATATRVGERMGMLYPSAKHPTTGNETGYDVKFLSPNASGGSVREAIRDYKNEIFTGFLASFLLFGQNEHGSFAMTWAHKSTFATVLESDLKALLDIYNRFAVNRLMQINGVPEHLWPRIASGNLADRPLQELVDFVVPLAQNAMLSPSPSLEDHLRKVGGLPPREEDAVDIYTQPKTPPQFGVEPDAPAHVESPGKPQASARTPKQEEM